MACGIHPGLPGFALPDAGGTWRGFDVDVCRAVAAATLGDATKVRFTTIGGQVRFGALQKGQIDILSRNTSQTFARAAGLGLSFPVTTYYDGQGFLVRRSLALGSAEELNGARICVQEGTASGSNLDDWFRVRGMKYRARYGERRTQRGRCTTTRTATPSPPTSRRWPPRARAEQQAPHVILPEVISGGAQPVVRRTTRWPRSCAGASTPACWPRSGPVSRAR